MKLIERLKKRVTQPAHPLFKTFSSSWVNDYTFSYKGQHFMIEATTDAEAWQKARMLVGSSDVLFLIEKGNAYCLIK